jgi:hypothetical protein
MKQREAVTLILTARKKARIIGGLLLTFLVLAGILGWIFWKWYTLVLVAIFGILFTSLYSLLQAKQISRKTGLSLEEQEKLLKEHE